MDILFEDKWLLVVNKPAGIATMGDGLDQPSILAAARAYLAKANNSVASPFLGISGRLDVPVAGIVLVAKTSPVADALTQLYRNRRVTKVYQALVSGCVTPLVGSLHHWLRQAGTHAKVRVVTEHTPKAQEARLQYRVLHTYIRASRLEIQLLTGRKHQIRTQLSFMGHPIWGDYKYGSRMDFSPGIALLAQGIAFCHPVTQTELSFVVNDPPYWPNHASIDALSESDKTWLARPARQTDSNE